MDVCREGGRRETAMAAKDEIPGLTGIRGLAAAAVVGGHVQLAGFGYSFLAVDVFFALSGYVLAAIYRQHCDARAFFLARAARTLPVHIVVLLAAAVVMGASPSQLIFDLLLVGVPWFAPHYGIIWSLAIEWYAYALFPVAIVTLRRVRPGVAAAFSLILIAAGWFEPSANWATAILDGAGAITGPHALARGLGAFGLGMALQRSGWRPGRSWLDAAPIRWIGDISYPLYLAHPLVIFVTAERIAPTGTVLGAVSAIAASVLLAAAVHYLVEDPARRWLRRRFAATRRFEPGNRAALGPSSFSDPYGPGVQPSPAPGNIRL